MMRFTTVAVAAVAAAGLGGCASMDWGTHLANFKYTPGEQDSVVLISGGSPSTCLQNPMSVRILADGDSSHFNVVGISGFNSPLDTSMYKDHQGVLMAMRLAPGRYYAALWPFNAMNVPTATWRADFTVDAGEVVYLGEIFQKGGCDFTGMVRGRLQMEAFESFNDQFDRDMTVLAKINPALAHASIKKRVLVNPHSSDMY